jgi:hypothetical protein
VSQCLVSGGSAAVLVWRGEMSLHVLGYQALCRSAWFLGAPQLYWCGVVRCPCTFSVIKHCVAVPGFWGLRSSTGVAWGDVPARSRLSSIVSQCLVSGGSAALLVWRGEMSLRVLGYQALCSSEWFLGAQQLSWSGVVSCPRTFSDIKNFLAVPGVRGLLICTGVAW